MDLLNSLLNFVVPPASMVMLAFAWPTLTFIHAVEWFFRSFFFRENMEDKVVIVTGASSAIGEWDHLVNTANLGHTFYFEDAVDTSVFPRLMDINFWGNVYPTYIALPFLKQTHGRIVVNASVESWLPMPRMSLYSAAKAAVMNFYETLRFEVKDDVGITIATHGWFESDMSNGRFMLEEGAEMQWKEERDVPLGGKQVEEYASIMVSGACKGDAYVKHPSWHDIFLVYRVLVPDVLGWTFRLLFTAQSTRKDTASIAVGPPRPLLEAPPSRKAHPSPLTFSSGSPRKME